MIFVTGDTHGDFYRIFEFCKRMETTTDDVMIILGDAGINYYGGKRDIKTKELISNIPITLFCIHGNHECRPSTIETYKEENFFGSKVLVEPEYPNIKFAIDGEIYWINGISTLVIGGAYSVDKFYRLSRGWNWFQDEQPDDKIKSDVELSMDIMGWNVDCVLSHTTPLKYEPVEDFIIGLDQSTVDTSTETWLDQIEDKLNYKKWYAGHFHCDKWKSDKLRIMFNDIEEFNSQGRV